ncbi:MAG: type IV pilin-like G/H family protein [Cyanobacteria bacterium P01_A01_bin.68]
MKKLTLIGYGLIFSLLGCVNYVTPESAALNKMQGIATLEIAYILEKNKFTSDFDELGVTFKPEERNHYSYKFIFIEEQRIVQFAAVAKQLFLKSYTGVTYLAIDKNKNSVEAKYIICESDNSTQKSPDKVELIDEKVECPNGYSLIE